MTTEQDNIFTVSRLNAQVRLLLENEMGVIWLVGELSNFSCPTSGHWYFTLKDNQAQVKAAMFRGNNRFVTFKPTNGDQVLVRARISLYEPRGDYQIIVESMQPEGDGLLKQQFEQLKMRLAAEGLFTSSNKRPLPLHPKCIGIVTSKTGAALHDILQILKRRDSSLHVIIYPTQVQGKDAAVQIANAIKIANSRRECDVLIVGRGGGSLEDLWCFNEEIVARAIADSHIPIISAVGHEVDVTICDYVADMRAPTPSAAAELVSQDLAFKEQQLKAKYIALQRAIDKILQLQNNKLIETRHRLSLSHPRTKLQQQAQRFDDLEKRLNQAILKKIQSQKVQLEQSSNKLKQSSPNKQITAYQTELAFLFQRLSDAMNNRVRQYQHKLSLNMETLNAVSPLATLSRGYSINQDANNKVLRSIDQTEQGQQLITILFDGRIYSTIERIEKTSKLK